MHRKQGMTALICNPRTLGAAETGGLSGLHGNQLDGNQAQGEALSQRSEMDSDRSGSSSGF